MKRSAFFLIAAALCAGQTKVNLGNQGTNPDFSALPHTRPATVGTTLPATCRVGELFFLSTATAGQNLYSCVAANVWLVSSGSGGGGGIAGPSSSTANAIPRWIGSGGSALNNSTATIDDSGNAVFSGSVTTGDATQPGCVDLFEIGANGNNGITICAPPSIATSLQLTLPNGTPSSGQVLTFGAPVSGVTQSTYQTLNNQSIQVSGSSEPQRAALNFNGGITCVDNIGNNSTDCAAGGGGGSASAPAGYGFLFPAQNWGGDFTSSIAFAANQLKVIEINVPVGFTVTKAHLYISGAASTSTLYAGIYDGTCSTLLSSGSGSSASPGLVNLSLASAALSAGTYYMALADSSGSVTLGAMSFGTVGGAGINQGTHPMFATAANAVSSGALPSSCGALSAVSISFPYAIFDN